MNRCRSRDVVVENRQRTGLGVEAADGVEPNLDAERNERTKPAVNPRAERNPFLWCLGAGRDRQQDGESKSALYAFKEVHRTGDYNYSCKYHPIGHRRNSIA
jgi:hypothetical protein